MRDLVHRPRAIRRIAIVARGGVDTARTTNPGGGGPDPTLRPGTPQARGLRLGGVVRAPGTDDPALGLQDHGGGPELRSIDRGGLAAARAPGDARGQAVTHRGEAGEHRRQIPQRECGNQETPCHRGVGMKLTSSSKRFNR